MVWVRIDDQFTENPKIATLGSVGIGVYVTALCYANRWLTDGFIPGAKVPQMFMPAPEDVDPSDPTEVLAMFGPELWTPVKAGIAIHDYAQFQPLRVEIELARERNSARARTAARARWSSDGAVADAAEHAPEDAAKHAPKNAPHMPRVPGPVLHSSNAISASPRAKSRAGPLPHPQDSTAAAQRERTRRAELPDCGRCDNTGWVDGDPAKGKCDCGRLAP